MNFTLKLMNRDVFEISQDDYAKIGTSDKGLVYLPDANITINTTSVVSIEESAQRELKYAKQLPEPKNDPKEQREALDKIRKELFT